MQVASMHALEVYRQSLVDQGEKIDEQLPKLEDHMRVLQQNRELIRHKVDEVTLDLYAAGWGGPASESEHHLTLTEGPQEGDRS